MEMDAIVLTGPDVATTEKEFKHQSYRLEKRVCPQGVRIVAENLGGNRFKVVAENIGKFRIYLSPEMGDLDRPFSVELDDGCVLLVNVERISGERDYTARLEVNVN